jgi:hypothetical protein
MQEFAPLHDRAVSAPAEELGLGRPDQVVPFHDAAIGENPFVPVAVHAVADEHETDDKELAETVLAGMLQLLPFQISVSSDCWNELFV